MRSAGGSTTNTPVAHRLSNAGLAVAIVAIIVASSVGVLAFTRDDGATTPEAAVRGILSAVEAGDLVGVLEQLPPGERKALTDGGLDLVDQLQQVGLVGAIDQRHIAGVSVTDSALALRTSPLADDMESVDLISGTITVSVPPGDSLLPASARGLLEEMGYASVGDPRTGWTATRDLATDPVRVIVIREGGGWHVSLAYTVSEAMREAAGPALPEMGTGPPGKGASTPQEAVSDLFDAYASADAERLVTLMYPDEARALYDYAPVFLPGARDAAANAEANGTYLVQVNRLTTTTDGAGSIRTVTVRSIDIDIRDMLHKTHLVLDGGCLTIDHRIDDDDDPYDSAHACGGAPARPADAFDAYDNPVANMAIFGSGVALPTFTVVERTGRWYVSPTRTALGSIAATLALAPSPEALSAFADRLQHAWESGAGEGLTGNAPTQAQSTPEQLIEGCRTLTAGPRAAEVSRSCIDRLVATKRIAG